MKQTRKGFQIDSDSDSNMQTAYKCVIWKPDLSNNIQ